MHIRYLSERKRGMKNLLLKIHEMFPKLVEERQIEKFKGRNEEFIVEDP